MNRTKILEALRPHARRPIRTFLADKSVATTEAERAFWAAIYANIRCTDHGEAVRIAAALQQSHEHVERVLEGWRP
jgi:hypothetical protein